jgi:G3E family GTPase
LCQELNSLAEVCCTEHAAVPLDWVLDCRAYDSGELKPWQEAAPELTHAHTLGVSSVSLALERFVVVHRLECWLAGLLWQPKAEDSPFGFLAMEVFRMKGILSVEGSDQKHILQVVHGLFEVKESSESWTDGAERRSKVVIIGRNLNRRKLESGMEACLT